MSFRPDTLRAAEAERDFGFSSKVGLQETVAHIKAAHAKRLGGSLQAQ